MFPFRSLAVGLAAGSVLVGVAVAGEAERHQDAWRRCLVRNFSLDATLTGRDLAADAAIRACRGAEEAYGAALAASPLLDEADIARARPALAARARGWLLGSRMPNARSASR